VSTEPGAAQFGKKKKVWDKEFAGNFLEDAFTPLWRRSQKANQIGLTQANPGPKFRT
jgi:hypothetical protein